MADKVLVVGGGTAGWMTASYLAAAFGDRVSVTVVESPSVPTIGVGEATFSTIRHFFAYLGLREEDWMPECHGTYKLAVRLENWRAPGDSFYHPFERLRVVDGFTLAEWWLHERPSERFDADCFVLSTLIDNMKSPKHLDGSLFEADLRAGGDGPAFRGSLTEEGTQFPYAYHFDAALLAQYLTGHATARGVQHVKDVVTNVALDERGWISHLATKEHGDLAADLYVDCTGFRGLLLGQAMGEAFESFQDQLPNDRAVALRVPLDMVENGMRPCTTATAMDAGWIWTIPLFGRVGTGYVYAGDYCSAEDAETTLRAFVGPAADGLEANHIRMRIGRSRRAWVNNCVAIGLSAGFVEPLQSTGIFLIQNAIEQLVKHFPAAGRDDGLSASYNRKVGDAIDGVREFLVLHYHGAARADTTYWRDAKTRPLPDGMQERLDLWRTRLPDSDTVWPAYHGFEPYSWNDMLLGLGGLPLSAPPALDLLNPRAAREEFRRVRAQADRLVAALPTHREYLEHMYGSVAAA